MSQFGDGTLKQDLLAEIEAVINEHGVPLHTALGDLADVLGFLCTTAFNSDNVLKVLRVEAVEQAKTDLAKQLRNMNVTETPKINLPKSRVSNNGMVPKRKRGS